MELLHTWNNINNKFPITQTGNANGNVANEFLFANDFRLLSFLKNFF